MKEEKDLMRERYLDLHSRVSDYSQATHSFKLSKCIWFGSGKRLENLESQLRAYNLELMQLDKDQLAKQGLAKCVTSAPIYMADAQIFFVFREMIRTLLTDVGQHLSSLHASRQYLLMLLLAVLGVFLAPVLPLIIGI